MIMQLGDVGEKHCLMVSVYVHCNPQGIKPDGMNHAEPCVVRVKTADVDDAPTRIPSPTTANQGARQNEV